MRPHLSTAVLALVMAGGLTGCSSSGSDTTAGDPADPASTAPTAPTALPSFGDPTSAASALGDVPDPCTLVPAAAVGRLVGAKVKPYPSDYADLGIPSRACGYSNDDPDVASVTLQVLPGSVPLDQVVALTGSVSGSGTPVDDVSVAGADDATELDETDDLGTTVTVFATDGELTVTSVVLADTLSQACRVSRAAAALLVAAHS